MSSSDPGPCPICGGTQAIPFWSRAAVPVENASIYKTAEEARRVESAALTLAGCDDCGFAWNIRFAGDFAAYDTHYEGTQTASGRFNAHMLGQIDRLRDALPLPEAPRVVEFGAGQGEFLAALAHRLGATGTGFDPAYRPKPEPDGVIMRDHAFPETLAAPFDLLVCRMTLEHLAAPDQVARQMATQRAGADARLFLTVPDARRIWQDAAFWDIYYEHANYFTDGVLRRLLTRAGFREIEIHSGFGGHYLEATARFPAAREEAADQLPAAARPKGGFRAVGRQLEQRVAALRDAFRSRAPAAGSILFWGGGSKAVALLDAVPEAADRSVVVDINPARRGKFLPGSGQRIAGPNDLDACRPSLVIVMNENYLDEVRTMVTRKAISADCIAVNDPRVPELIRTSSPGQE